MVDVNAEHSRARMQLAGDVAVTRGVNLRVFGPIPAAQEWLKNQAPPTRTAPP